jgi:hypothetical protein
MSRSVRAALRGPASYALTPAMSSAQFTQGCATDEAMKLQQPLADGEFKIVVTASGKTGLPISRVGASLGIGASAIFLGYSHRRAIFSTPMHCKCRLVGNTLSFVQNR